MKKNININIYGTIYAIDEDAYQLLENYLESMKRYFKRQEGGDEIADDIEHRVAELLWEQKEQGMELVNIDTVKEIIDKIGRAAEIDNDTNEQENAEEPGNPADDADSPQAESEGKADFFDKLRYKISHQRLYRNGQDKMVGGVCSGLAEYFGTSDVTFWRLGAVLLTIVFYNLRPLSLPYILSFLIPLFYLALMIIVPEAVTPEDKLRMKGREVNPQNLKEQIVSETETDTGGSHPTSGDGRRPPSGCLRILFYLFLTILLFPIVILSIAMVIAAVIILYTICFGTVLIASVLEAPFVTAIDELGVPLLGSCIAGIAALALTIWGIVAILRPSGRKASTGAVATGLVAWVIAVGICIAGGIYFAFKMEKFDDDYRARECTRDGITLDNMQQWQRIDELGWKIKKMENIHTYNLIDHDYDSPHSLPDYYVRIHRNNDAKPISIAMERNEHLATGYYILEAITDNGSNGLQMTVADAAKPQEPLATIASGSEGTDLQATGWRQAAEMGIITAGDSTQWKAESTRETCKKLLTSAPFYHAGGDVVISITADNRYLNSCTVRSLRLKAVEKPATRTKHTKKS